MEHNNQNVVLQKEVNPVVLCFVSLMTKINEQNNQKKSTTANLMTRSFFLKGLVLS